jgi:hypothetical protein
VGVTETYVAQFKANFDRAFKNSMRGRERNMRKKGKARMRGAVRGPAVNMAM